MCVPENSCILHTIKVTEQMGKIKLEQTTPNPCSFVTRAAAVTEIIISTSGRDLDDPCSLVWLQLPQEMLKIHNQQSGQAGLQD